MSSDNLLGSGKETPAGRGRKKSAAKVELIEVNGKTVSKSATGKRKFHTKSKNGCDNCKRRRVKCDETRPHCLNCLRMNLECVYSTPQPKKRKGSCCDQKAETVAKVSKPVTTAAESDLLATSLKQEETNHVTKPSSAGIRDPLKRAPASNNPVLPPLSHNSNFLQHLQQQLQQQPYLLPQLMTLTNSEKFAAQFEVPNTPGNAASNLQSQPMNLSNSISSLLAGAKLPPSLSSNLEWLQQLTQSPQRQQDLKQRNTSSSGANNTAANPVASFNLKDIGTFPTAGIGGVTYNFQELLGLKSPTSNLPNDSVPVATAKNGATSQDSAVEVLASLQMNQQQKHSAISANNTLDIDSSCLPNNPTISPAAPMSPLTKLEDPQSGNGSGAKLMNNSGAPVITHIAANMPKFATEESQESREAESSRLGSISKMIEFSTNTNLNLIDLRLFHHYCTEVWPTITAAGISEKKIWSKDVPEIAFEYPFLMHALLAFSATHYSRTECGLERYVTQHRLEALRLLREAVLEIDEANTDALVASAIILIMDSLANAASPGANGVKPSLNNGSISTSAWIFHVKGAATILTAVWPLTEKSRFYNLINVDLSALGDIVNRENSSIAELVCFDDSIADLYPVEINSPYLITLAYLDKLNKERGQPGFILRVFAFPALLDKTFLALLMTGDLGAMRIMRSYYQLLRSFASEMNDKVWFLEGMNQVLPQDVDEYSGGGGMHMMLDFLGGGLPSMTTTNLSDFGIF